MLLKACAGSDPSVPEKRPCVSRRYGNGAATGHLAAAELGSVTGAVMSVLDSRRGVLALLVLCVSVTQLKAFPASRLSSATSALGYPAWHGKGYSLEVPRSHVSTMSVGVESAVGAMPQPDDAWTLLLDATRQDKPAPPPRPAGGFNTAYLDSLCKDPLVRAEIEGYWRSLETDLTHLTKEERGKVKFALNVAYAAHRGQRRRSGQPYIVHPIEVAKILGGLKMDPETIISGLLHDTVEDTGLTLGEIEAMFGHAVKTIVQGETKVSKISKLGSAPSACVAEETQAENLRSLFLAMTDDWRVIFVKLADRLHNMRTLDAMPAVKQVKIARETLDIYAPLADRLGVRTIKQELEDRAFQFVHPREFEEISAQLREKNATYSAALQGAQDALTDLLSHLRLNLTVQWRLKERYSIYRKLERKRAEEGRPVTLEELHDVGALRVIVHPGPGESESSWKKRGLFLCYRLRHLIFLRLSTYELKHLEEDYITCPKANGYQSLHLPILRNGVVMECQIRTDWMHQLAENGVAAHWLYKDDQGRKLRRSHYRAAWLACLKELEENECVSSKDFVETVRTEILGRRVSFFLKNGIVRDVARGATVLDAAFSLNKQIGYKLRLAEVNGLPADLSREVQNGDVVSFCTALNAVPFVHWASSVAKCRTTRSKLRAYFKTREPEAALTEGRRLVQNFVVDNAPVIKSSRGGVLPTEGELEAAVAAVTNHDTLGDLYFQVALSNDSAECGALLAKVLGLRGVPLKDLDLSALGSEARKQESPRGRAVACQFSSRDGRETIRLCPECCPVKGDEMLGERRFDEQEGDRVMVVHTSQSSCVLDTDARALVRVNATEFAVKDFESIYPVPLKVTADRSRLYVLSSMVERVMNCTALLVDMELLDDRRMVIRVLVAVRDLLHLNQVMRACSKVKGVVSVERILDQPTDACEGSRARGGGERAEVLQIGAASPLLRDRQQSRDRRVAV